jgi:hypothetical protein
MNPSGISTDKEISSRSMMSQLKVGVSKILSVPKYVQEFKVGSIFDVELIGIKVGHSALFMISANNPYITCVLRDLFSVR